MTELRSVSFAPVDLDALATAEGRVAVVIPPEGTMSPVARRLNRLTKGAVARAVESPAWEKAEAGSVTSLRFAPGVAAEAVDLVKLPRKADALAARRAGAALAEAAGTTALTVALENTAAPEQFALGLVLRSYVFGARKSAAETVPEGATILVKDPDAAQAAADPVLAVAAGVGFTRDLVSEPANVLTTTEFAARLVALQEHGVEVEVFDEDRMADLGMGSLLSVGQGSDSPSKMVVMRWKGGSGDPLALVGKGVVFDTGGISLKPAAGMEAMTMDMGGAGVVAGAMLALARRKAKANVVGLVGLVENMPSGNATRPGDIVTSMKGDTIEVINTDAEGRLVLADVLWYAQEHENPAAIVDLATLTGACMVALGQENAGVFANDDPFCDAFLSAAKAEGEGAWRLPLAPAYDKLLKSQKADMKNTGGRFAGAITAAQFLQRFVKDDMPWIHLDIAGVCQPDSATALAPKGASGWGVMALDRLVRDKFEG